MKPTLKIGLVATVASLVFVAGYAKGQQEESPSETAQKEFIDLILKAEKAEGESARAPYAALAKAYLAAPNNAPVVQQIIHMAQVERDKTSSVVDLLSLQAAQNQKLLKQNEQIIQLLKQQKAK